MQRIWNETNNGEWDRERERVRKKSSKFPTTAKNNPQ